MSQCERIADIGFVVDSSGSMRRDFSKEKQFVKDLAGTLGIGKGGGNRAGIVTFSYNAELTAKLSDSVSSSSSSSSSSAGAALSSGGFNALVDKVPFMGYTTRIDKALKLVRKELFEESNGARAGVPKILFVLTDGTQTKDSDAVDPASIASELREKLGVHLFVIGIGMKVNPGELSRIAGERSRLFLAKDMNQLKSAEFISNISSLSCPLGMSLHCFNLLVISLFYMLVFW